MQRKELISIRQLGWLVCIILLGGGLLSLQRDLIRIAERDASFSYLLPLIYAFGLAMLFGYLSKKFPGKNMFHINQTLAGVWFGGILNGLIILQIISILIRDISIISNFVNIILIRETPYEIVILLLFFLLLYYGSLHIETVSRAADLLFPIFIMSLILMPLLLANEIELGHLQPVLANNSLQVWYSNVLNLGWYGDLIIAGAFLHTVANHEDLHPAMRHGIAISSFFLSVTLFMSIAVLGTSIGARSIFPEYVLIEQINITEFLDRVEIFMISFWMPMYMIKIAVSYIAITHGLRSFLKRPTTNALNKPLMLMLSIFTLYSFDSIIEVVSFSVYGSFLVVLLLQIPVIFIMVVLGFLNKTKQQVPKSTAVKSTKSAAGSRKWTLYSNLLILLCIGFIVIGALVSMDYPLIANYAALGYFISLFLVMFTTYKEMKKPSG